MIESRKPSLRGLLAAAMISTLGSGLAIASAGTAQLRGWGGAPPDHALIRQRPSKPGANASVRSGTGSRSSSPSYPRGGWTVAHGQRMARKARNVKANRGRHRG